MLSHYRHANYDQFIFEEGLWNWIKFARYIRFDHIQYEPIPVRTLTHLAEASIFECFKILQYPVQESLHFERMRIFVSFIPDRWCK